jgi:hypothetical protein
MIKEWFNAATAYYNKKGNKPYMALVGNKLDLAQAGEVHEQVSLFINLVFEKQCPSFLFSLCEGWG